MKLSEAIRLGAMLHKQGFYEWRTRDTVTDEIVATCALGAAGAAGYFDVHQVPRWIADCPACSVRGAMICSILAHLNDHHQWTREAIADWVATVEPADPVVTTSPVADFQFSSVDAVPVGSQSR